MYINKLQSDLTSSLPHTYISPTNNSRAMSKRDAMADSAQKIDQLILVKWILNMVKGLRGLLLLSYATRM